MTVNPDNRLMSGTTMTGEFELLVRHQGFTLADLRAITSNAVSAAFCDDETRARVAARIEAGYATP